MESIGAWDLEDIDSSYARPLILGQNRTQHILLDQLHALERGVEWNVEATNFAPTAEGAETTLKAGDAAAGRTLETIVR